MKPKINYITKGSTMIVDLRERMARMEIKVEVLPGMAEDVSEIKLILAEKKGSDSEKDKQEIFHRRKTIAASWCGSGGVVGILEAAIHWFK